MEFAASHRDFHRRKGYRAKSPPRVIRAQLEKPVNSLTPLSVSSHHRHLVKPKTMRGVRDN